MPSNSFAEASAPLLSQAPFALILGRMLLEFQEITQDQFDIVGAAQARTVVIAELFETNHDLQPAILEKFGNKNNQLDLNGVAFRYSTDTIVGELDDFLLGLNVPELDARLQAAKAAVDAEMGVHAKAAAAGALHQGLLLKQEDRKPVVNASLIMQMAVRGLKRVQAFEHGGYDRQTALDLLQLHNKMSYKSDSKELVGANQALLSICTAEMELHTELLNNDNKIDFETKNAYEFIIKRSMNKLIEAMPKAIEMYQSVGRTRLAAKAQEVYEYNKHRLEKSFIIQQAAKPEGSTPEPS